MKGIECEKKDAHKSSNRKLLEKRLSNMIDWLGFGRSIETELEIYVEWNKNEQVGYTEIVLTSGTLRNEQREK